MIMETYSVHNLQVKLLNWFKINGRHWIPWKLKADGSVATSGEFVSPYGIWIAEVMLQQTQLKVVIPYWERWMQSFPSLPDLVDASEQDVLLNWQGLGYYSRAKRIYQSSKVLFEFIGKGRSSDPSFWPIELDQWIELPGIGRSTAGSIISSAFDLPLPILDGNVKRILSRLYALEIPPYRHSKKLWQLSYSLLAEDKPRNFNQALMDLGSTVCTIKSPSCCACPIKSYCLAYNKYDPIDFPVKVMKKIIPNQEIGIGLIFNKQGELLIDQRHSSSSMGGMWEFPGGKKEAHESIKKTIEREIQEELGIYVKAGEKLISFEHSYSHKKFHFFVYLCEWISGTPKPLSSQKILWVTPKRLIDFPFPAANTKIISALYKYLGIGNNNL